MNKIHKREVPSYIKNILDVDIYMSDQFVKLCDKIVFLRNFKTHSKIFESTVFYLFIFFIIYSSNMNLEPEDMKIHFYIQMIFLWVFCVKYSCHGLIWIPCWIALIWVLNTKSLHQMQVNFFLGLLLDAFTVAVMKAFFRRRRPTNNQSSLEIGPDKFSFPSGHASRAIFIACFFSFVWSLQLIFIPALLAWAVSVCISRVLMRKHHLLDVVVGVLLGLIEAYIMSLIYLNKDTCTDLIWWLTDEKLDGGEYHV